MAYRGRVLLELDTVLDETPQTPVEDISNDDILRVQVRFQFTVARGFVFCDQTKPNPLSDGSTRPKQEAQLPRDSARWRSLRRSLSFKITDFGTNLKPVCDFLLANNSNLHPVLYRFQVVLDYWSHLRFRQGVPLFDVLV